MEFTGKVERTNSPKYMRVSSQVGGKTATSMVPVDEQFSYGDEVTVVWVPNEDNRDVAAAASA